MARHFTINELCASDTALAAGFTNKPPEYVRLRLLVTMDGMERVRELLGDKPIKIHSGYRCPELNKRVGGSPNSQHLRGEAVDFTCQGFGTIKAVATQIAQFRHIIGFDQLILEPNWVHISFANNPRHQVLTCTGPHRFHPGIV